MDETLGKRRFYSLEDEIDSAGRTRRPCRMSCMKICALVFAFGTLMSLLGFGFGYYYHQHQNPTNQTTEFITILQPPSSNISVIYIPAHKHDLKTELAYKREFIREMTRDAWAAYVKDGWPFEYLKPLTNGHSNKQNDRTILASMSTLWIMGLKVEFEKARNWIEYRMDFKPFDQIDVQDVVADYIGGLLSCYTLTGSVRLLEKAVAIGDELKLAYATTTGLSNKTTIPRSQKSLETKISPSSLGSQLLEYIYLNNLKNNSASLKTRIESILSFIKQSKGILYMNELDVNTGNWTDSSFPTLGSATGALYSSLIKAYIQSGKNDTQLFELYEDAISSVDGFFGSPAKNSTVYYLKDLNLNERNDRMSSSSCYLGAMLSLGVHVQMNRTFSNESIRKLKTVQAEKHWNLARELTETCHRMAGSSKTGLPPLSVRFRADGSFYPVDGRYLLSPELAESYFILYRLTHEQRYRDYSWELVQAIYRNCRTQGGGFTQMENVNHTAVMDNVHPDFDVQPTHFLSATLKFLYLTFTDDSVLPLDQWVFNSAGHPLPICGANSAYPKCNKLFEL